MSGWSVVLVAIAYLLLLFVVASYGDKRRGSGGPERSRPAIYSLSLAIYCTSWTFFGSVGLATTSGLDFLGIYLGPILVVTLGFPLFRHIILVSKAERITSVADFLASRYGKSTAVGALAALIAVIGTVPYIALQLKAVATSVDTMVNRYQPLGIADGAPVDTAFFVAALLALFAVLFGTRHADATEHQGGLILAVATESIVKLVAFLAVGLFVTFYLYDGIGDLIAQAQASTYVSSNFKGGINPATFGIFTLLSFFAFMLLPRQFHVGVVENHSEKETRTARWMFPLYLVLINLFVVPVAISGMLQFGQSVDPDSYVLALPLSLGGQALALLVFIGGLSAATAMVIVACVALAIMLSNNVVLPLLLRFDISNMASLLLNIRRTAIFGILALAYAYVVVAGDSAALASIGLLSFAAIAQFAPAFFGGLFWLRGTSRGAIWGLLAGIATWFYTLFLPTLLDPASGLMMEGPLGVSWLHPQGLLGLDAAPLTHGVIVSLAVNTLVYIAVSFSRDIRSIERLQGLGFSIFSQRPTAVSQVHAGTLSVADLRALVARYLGQERTNRAFEHFFKRAGFVPGNRDLASQELMRFAEQLLASAIGAASSRLVISLIIERHQEQPSVSTLQLLDDASVALQHNRDILQTAIDQVEQGIVVFDENFSLSSWNRQFRTLLHLPPELGQAGISLSEITRSIEEKWVCEDGLDIDRALLEKDRSFQLSSKLGDEIIDVQTRAMPDGGIVVSWHDVTERVGAARALQTANESLERRVEERTLELTELNDDLDHAREQAELANIGKTKFLAAVGHDILQPLNAARLYASTLTEKLAGQEEEELAQNVDSALNSVEDILGAVLAISRLDSGALSPNITSFAVQTLLDRLDNEFQPMAASKGLNLKIEPTGFKVRSDFNMLRRLLQNLVSNALKYTASGDVLLGTRLNGTKVVFFVSDTGPGIPLDQQDTAFEEFRRLPAGKEVAGGLGLGLSIVKRLAQTLDHPLKMNSVPTVGTTFEVEVPLARGAVRSGSDGVVKRLRTNLTGLEVLCIDNEPTILDGMQTLLEGWGCAVSLASNEQEALDQAVVTRESEDCLVAVVDFHLNDETGFDVIDALRSHAKRPLVAILVTADRSGDVRERAAKLDIAFLNKPLKPAALRALLSSHHNPQVQAAE